jgi:hypothetical protein
LKGKKMGYVNNTQMSTFIPPSMIAKTAGTWTPTIGSNVSSDVRTAADGEFTLLVPVPLPSNSAVRAGTKLKSIDLFYKIANAADDVATVALDKMSLKASGTALTGAAVVHTLDGGHDTAAKRKAAGEHTMTVTLTTPVYLDNDDHYMLSMVIDAAANTAFTLFGARANYELRL